MGDVRVPDLVTDGHHTGTDAVGDVVERTREDRRGVVDAVTVGIDRSADAVLLLAIEVHSVRALVLPFLEVGDAVRDGERLQIVFELPGTRAVVHRAVIGALGLRDEERAVRIDPEGDRVLDLRFRGDHGGLEALGHLGLRSLDRRGVVHRRDRRCCGPHDQHDQHDQGWNHESSHDDSGSVRNHRGYPSGRRIDRESGAEARIHAGGRLAIDRMSDRLGDASIAASKVARRHSGSGRYGGSSSVFDRR